jgi:hypothetical protein
MANEMTELDAMDYLEADATAEEITAKIAELQAAYDIMDCRRSRKAEYPSIGDQLDMIYHNGNGGSTFQAAIKAVKDKYPKG